MEQNNCFYRLVVKFLRPFVKLLFPYEVHGLDNIKNLNKKYIICSNHLSNMDPVFLMITHPKSIYFMAKAELFKNPICGWFFSKMGAFAVKRGKGDKSALDKSQSILKSSNILGIFIEGTRSKTGEFLRPKSGIAFLAHVSGSAVVPVCITGGGESSKVKLFKKTTITYGKPVLPEQLGICEGSRIELKNAVNLIMNSIKELR